MRVWAGAVCVAASYYNHPFPVRVEVSLPERDVAVVSFSRRGNLLATGYLDGRCVIWDFDVLRVCRVLIAHGKAVTGLRLAPLLHGLQVGFLVLQAARCRFRN